MNLERIFFSKTRSDYNSVSAVQSNQYGLLGSGLYLVSDVQRKEEMHDTRRNMVIIFHCCAPFLPVIIVGSRF